MELDKCGGTDTWLACRQWHQGSGSQGPGGGAQGQHDDYRCRCQWYASLLVIYNSGGALRACACALLGADVGHGSWCQVTPRFSGQLVCEKQARCAMPMLRHVSVTRAAHAGPIRFSAGFGELCSSVGAVRGPLRVVFVTPRPLHAAGGSCTSAVGQ